MYEEEILMKNKSGISEPCDKTFAGKGDKTFVAKSEKNSQPTISFQVSKSITRLSDQNLNCLLVLRQFYLNE